jgi:beta-glucosidase
VNSPAVPADFRWGVSTSAYQTEGAVALDGRRPSIWDEFCRVPLAIERADTGVDACDSYRRWPDDLDLLRRLGVDSYRFSVAWPRVLPHGRGPVNAAGLDHYDAMVDDLLEAGIHPFVTLYHWDLPAELQRQGGWVARETAYRLADYAEVVAQRLGDRVRDWTTINEPLCSAWIGHLEGRMAPGVRDLGAAVAASYNLLLAHGLATQAVRAAAAHPASVGIVLNLSPCEPASDRAQDVRAAERADGHTNRWWLDPLHGRGFPADMRDVYGIELPAQPGDEAIIATPIDFLGVNYYFRMVVAADPGVATLGYTQVPVPGARTTSMGWEVHAQGLTDLLLRVAKEYDVPALYVTESGSAWDDEPDAAGDVADPERAAYLREHIDAALEAAGRGAPLKGFYCWSLMDNFEWSYGYAPRFGLAYVDYATQRRTLKQSGYDYAALIASHRSAGAAAIRSC